MSPVAQYVVAAVMVIYGLFVLLLAFRNKK